jgi:hypothetical protein
MAFLPVVVFKPICEALNPGLKRRSWPEAGGAPEVFDIGVGGDHIAGLQWKESLEGSFPERPLERADEFHQAHRRALAHIE